MFSLDWAVELLEANAASAGVELARAVTIL
jgi:hypothetical protein